MSKDMIMDQKVFMELGDQTTNEYNEKQLNLYFKLIREEVGELEDAIIHNSKPKILDALMDILVVTLGASHSLGINVQGAWDHVVKSNMSKVDVKTGKILKRADGKILKPSTFLEPNFKQFFEADNEN